MKLYPFLIAILTASACNNPGTTGTTGNSDTTQVKPTVTVDFNGDSAYQYVKSQVDFGPRVPGSTGHTKCHAYLVQLLKQYADTVYEQNTTARTYDNHVIPVKNIIAAFNPKMTERILLCAHWDTRPFADQDTKDRDKPILGANDGASGVGVLLEIARNLSKQSTSVGIDIVLFDAEDWGDNSGKTEDSYCLGSQYWSKNLHIPGYKAEFGILLDMVGAPNALFGYEDASRAFAAPTVSLVWQTAAKAGYGDYFKDFDRGGITDDHVYIMRNASIPTIDIIDFDPMTSSKFGKYWHTHADNMDAISAKTLKAVGQTLHNVIYNY
ncbi:MAG: M28 family peptidase [Bacteroidota bacterium]